MDLTQRKLSKSEWDGIEIPVNKDELEILQLIVNGFSNVQLKVNNTNSIFTQLKIEYNDQIEEFLYANFFADKIKILVQKYNIPFINPTIVLSGFNQEKVMKDNLGHYTDFGMKKFSNYMNNILKKNFLH